MSETMTLKEMLRSVESNPINLEVLAESIIRRCAEVARMTDDGSIADACADAILSEAGLDEVKHGRG